MVKGKCFVDLCQHKLTVTFQEENMKSFVNCSLKFEKNYCNFKVVDLVFIYLKNFGFNIVSQTSNKGSVPKGIISTFNNTLNVK